MPGQIRYDLTDDRIRRVLRRIWLRHARKPLLIVAALWAGSLALALWGPHNRGRPLLFGLIAFLTILLWGFFRNYRQGGIALKALDDPVVTLTFDDEAIQVTRGGIETRYRWETVETLWRYPEEWIVKLAGQILIVPIDDAPPELLAFIEARLPDRVRTQHPG
jgi:hypothetical protein